MSPSPTTSDRQGAFSFSAVLILLAVGITAFCAFVVLGAFAPERHDDEEFGATPLSNSAVGYAGLIQLLRAEDVPVAIDHAGKSLTRRELRIVTPAPDTHADPASEAVDGAVQLFVLPKWQVAPDPEHSGWVRRLGGIPLATLKNLAPDSAPIERRFDVATPVLRGVDGVLTGLKCGRIEELQTSTASLSWTPVIRDAVGRAVLLRSNRVGPPLYLLTDPDLINNQGLKSRETARVAMVIIAALRGDAPVAFEAEPVPGKAEHDRSLLQALLTPPLLGATLCATACGLLILGMALHRFGPALVPQPILGFGKRALADNAAAMITLAGREPRMARPYADLTRTLALADVGAPAHLPPGQADVLLDEAGRLRGMADTFTGLVAEAGRVRDRGALLLSAQRLHHWREGLRRGHR